MSPRREEPASPTRAKGGSAIALILTLAALLAARAVAAATGGMWAWALNLNRFLAPPTGWGLWGVAVVLTLPPVARRLAPWSDRAGDAIGRGGTVTALTAALAAVALAWFMPDRVRFVGDFLLRQGTVEIAEKSTIVFPQALPLDVLFHVNVPGWLLANGFADANGAARVLGVVEIALFALLALRLARVLELRRGAAFACAATVFFGGYLCMFTGFGKAFAELCLLVAWTAVSGLDLIRRGRGAVSLGLAVAIAATLHRSGLGLVPAAAFAWVAGWRVHATVPRVRRTLRLSLVAPIVSLAVMVPRIVAIVRQWDTVHFRPHEVVREGGVLAATFAGTRAADIFNLLVMLSPLVATLLTVLPLLLITRVGSPEPAPAPARRGTRVPPAATPPRGAEPLFLGLLALPFLAMMPFIHPAQGMFRDWDDFCATGVAVSMLVAWTLAGLLRPRPEWGWLAVAVAAGVAMPTVQWLEAQRDLGRGLARVRAFVVEPPRRTDEERGKTWDFLGIRHVRLGNDAASAHRDDEAHREYLQAADALAHAAETAPSPRILQEWGLAAALADDYATARDVYHRLLDKDPNNAYVWMSLAAVDMNLRDLAGAKAAGQRVLALEPGNRNAAELLHDIEMVESGQARMP
jgi:hypothetical protein